MKKIISFILTLAMVMSLGSVPVFAADTITSTDEGNNSASQSVTANYIPEAEKAAITGVSVTVDGKTYNSGDTVTLTPNSGNVTITVSGSNLTNLNANNNKLLLYAENSPVGVSTADGWTVDADNNTVSKTFELSTFQNCTTAFEIKYSNEGDVSDKYTGSGIYIQYQNKTVSVGITWGAMNFTYSDEQVEGSDKGWTCETGANTVKVENNGDESIVAEISYKQADGYTAISGTFDKTSETIAKDGNATFTLTLSGKPDAALNGTNIGSVTVAITDAISIATEDDLITALKSGGKYKLGQDVSLEVDDAAIENSTSVTLDLNGKTLTDYSSYWGIMRGSTLIICDNAGNGKVMFGISYGLGGSSSTHYMQSQGTLIINGGVFQSEGNKYSIVMTATTAITTVNGGTIDSINVSGGKLTVTGGHIGTLTCGTYGNVEIIGGTFGFDPTQYVDTDNYDVTASGSTWTVKAKQNN